MKFSQRIVELLNNAGRSMTNREIMAATEASNTHVTNTLHALTIQRKVVCERSGRGGVPALWRLAQPGELPPRQEPGEFLHVIRCDCSRPAVKITGKDRICQKCLDIEARRDHIDARDNSSRITTELPQPHGRLFDGMRPDSIPLLS